jgi:hypothetical protein
MTTYRIFLASSEELLADRDAFELRISRISKDWRREGVDLEVDRWEHFLDAMSATRLQDEYNAAILKCDVFVMLFWTKVGQYTEEEFNTAFGQFKTTKKPFIYTYFKNEVGASRSNNPANEKSLLAFKEKLKLLGHFYTPYKNIEGLQLHFRGQLDMLRANGFINFPAQGSSAGSQSYEAQAGDGSVVVQGDHAIGAMNSIVVGGNNTGALNTGTQTNYNMPGGAVTHIGQQTVHHHVAVPIANTADAAQAASAVTKYLHALSNSLAGLDLKQIDNADQTPGTAPLQLLDVYVPLDTRFLVPEGSSLHDQFNKLPMRTGTSRTELAQQKTRAVSLTEALAYHRELTVLGAAGSGKSAFGASVLLTFAKAWLDKTDLAQSYPGWAHGLKLPIRLVLRKFVVNWPSGGHTATAGDLWDFICAELRALGFDANQNAIAHVLAAADKQGALFVFDGLDECGNEARRQHVLNAIEDFIKSAGKHCRFVLTTRPWARLRTQNPVVGIYELAEMNAAQTAQFIGAWYDALVLRRGRERKAANSKRDNLATATQRPSLQEMARSPLLLTLMATVHTSRGELPDDRVTLYDESVNLLMENWNKTIGADRALLAALATPTLTMQNLRGVLEKVAFNAHSASKNTSGVADIPEADLLAAFSQKLDDSWDKAKLVLHYIETRAGILIGELEKEAGGLREFKFPHRTFQEYLAACHLAGQLNFDAECLRLSSANWEHWELVLPLAARAAGHNHGASAADGLVGRQPVADRRKAGELTSLEFTRAWLAGLQLKEIGLADLRGEAGMAPIIQRVAGWLAASLPVICGEKDWIAKQRAAAGDLLATLGDPRFGPHRF